MQDKKPEKEASEEMEEAFRAGIGSTDAKCELCGIHFFASGDQSLGYEDGELEALQEKAARWPGKYQELPMDDGVSIGQIAGMRFVIGHGCKGLRKYEDFIWGARRGIAKYLKKRAQDRLETAQDEFEQLKDL